MACYRRLVVAFVLLVGVNFTLAAGGQWRTLLADQPA